MTATKLQLTGLPFWPRWLTREEASAYVGVSVATFDDEVHRGIWPPGMIRPAGAHGRIRPRLTWDRMGIDKCSDELSGVR